MTPKQIGIDFDGTLTCHMHPFIGEEVPHAIRVIKRLQNAGHILILYTMRHEILLDQALQWCKDKGLSFSYVNENPLNETGSRKTYFHYLIDDHNVGSPMIYDPAIHHRPFVDWLQIERILEAKGLI